jgi:hypothetical protein
MSQPITWISSIQWLEDFLINAAKAVVISHDRAFVDNITNRTIEVTMGRIYDYKASILIILSCARIDVFINKSL